MADEKGHKYTERGCCEKHECACGCRKKIRPGDRKIEHNFMKNGHWCTEYYHVGHL